MILLSPNRQVLQTACQPYWPCAFCVDYVPRVCALIAHQLVVDSGAVQMWPDAVQRSQRTLDCLHQPEAVAEVIESVMQCSVLGARCSLLSGRCAVLGAHRLLLITHCSHSLLSLLTDCCSL